MNRKRAVFFLLLSTVAYLSLFLIVPHLPIKTQMAGIIATIMTTVLFMGIQIALVRWVAEVRLLPRTTLFALIGASVLFAAGFVLIATSQHDKLLQLVKDPKILDELRSLKPSFSSYSLLYTTYRGPLMAFMNLLVITGAAMLGYLVSFLIRERNLILPVAVFAAFIDIWTVNVGPTAKVIQSAPEIVETVSAQIPTPGAGHIAPISFVGPGDFLFLAILFGAMCRLGMNASRTYWFIFPLMAVGMLVVIMGDGLLMLLRNAGTPAWLLMPMDRITSMGLPALVLVALGVILANFREFKLQRSELKAIGIVAAVIAFLALIITPFLTRSP